ncbi:amino acid adenylation domain-containing protein [Hymenobacter sp. HSC-4F20]|uniref:non-ribosomal peptide synthetase n=1 Tax=Hymenobacter sp. HSC-4F20 TaxID=2864135 RepID=UPI001C736FD9|nr:non-ribosomal peptide synthetase [Hymenobacter sp. HSC-4F20]MBX0293011.1 amino acid adenylation domain-containing protein [Hymenobacter sp. HSC-4F20]
MEQNSLTLQGYSLAPAQARTWDSISQVQQAGTWATAELNGTIASEKVQRILQQVVQRHNSLAMYFGRSSALHYPLQQPQQAATLACATHDWQDQDAAAQQQLLASLQTDWAAPVALNTPVRAALIQLAPTRTLLWLRAHPLQADAASLHVLLQEVAALCNGAELTPTEDVLPYENYASWQQELLADADTEALTYWKQYRPYYFQKPLVPFEQKAGAPRALARRRLVAEPAVFQALQAQCAAHSVSLRNLLLSLFARFLYSFERPEHFVIGLQRFDRLYDELKHAVGAMGKTVPLLVKATDFGPEANPATLLEQREEELLDWEDFFSFAHVGKEDTDFYSYGFGYLPAAAFQPLGQNVTVTLTDLHAVAEAHALQLVVQEQATQLVFDFYYATNAYPDQSIELVAEQWSTFLRRKLALSPADQLAQCAAGRAEQSTAITPQTVLELFQEQVARHPAAAAVVYKQTTLSYAQLDAASTRLAHVLRQRYHIGPGSHVALLLGRSQWLPISILAVLKAGAAYVPIDTAYPDTRISQIIESGRCQLVLSEVAVWSQKQQLCQLTALLLDEDDVLAGASTEPLPLPALSDLAYIIFTSGSTGKPKGVMIQHGSLTNYVQWSNNYYFAPGERGNWALFTSIAFDLTVTAIYTSLCRGQVLFISDAEKHILSILEEAVDAEKGLAIDILKLTPSHVAMLKNLPLTRSTVKKVIVGGEALEWDHIHTLRKLNPDIEIYNEYGPTEATVGCVVQKVTPQDERIFIGEPIANTTVCVLDEALECVGNSCIGELYIGGDCLAQGYLHQPELTAKSFVTLPWDPQQRTWYKTGDLVRQNADGIFDYLGRADKQVKIRGYRIEPGEIQAVLLQVPGVSNALVGVLKHEEESYLVGYLQAEEPVEVARVRSYLAERLPAYMVPMQWLQVKAFPLTPNGKVDEKALAQLATEQKQAEERPYVAPTTVLEAELQKIWEQVLKQNPVSVQADFFSLGGNSLNFSQLILRVNQAFGKKVSFSEFFDYLTVEKQAAFLAQARPEAAARHISVAPAQERYPLTPAQYSIWKACQSEGSTVAYNMPFVLRLEGELDATAFAGAVAAVAARHESLRTVFRKNADWTVSQQVLPTGPVAELLTQQDLRGDNLSSEALQAKVLAEIRTPFDLAAGPLMRLKLWQLGTQEHVLVYTLHHIIGDGWSMQVLFDELMQAYNALTAGQPLRLPPLPIQYKDYAAWLTASLAGEEGQRLEQYWLSQFAEAVPVLDLSPDFPRPEHRTYAGKTLTADITQAEYQALLQLGAAQEGTLFMTLLLATNVLLHKYTGQTDMVIGTPMAGREHLDLEGQIGLYVNTLALRSTFSGEHTVTELYQQVKQQVVGATSHQLYPFDTLLQQLNLPLQAGRSPLFDVMIVLQNIDSQQAPAMPTGLTISRFGSDLESSKYDLCFFFVEEAGAVRVHLEYDTALFREDTVQALLGNLRHLAGQLTPAASLRDLSLLASATEAEEADLFLAQMLEM